MDEEPSQAVVDKALAYVRAGKVTVVSVEPPRLSVQGSAEDPYVVRAVAGEWVCDCPATVTCSHMLPAQWMLVPGTSVPSVAGTDDILELLEV